MAHDHNGNHVRKVVIPVAGFGTRFLPMTKAMPKEMLPVVDKPIIQYVVEEAVASGIEDVILVTGWHKRSIEDHFDYPFELEKRLEEAGKHKLADEVRHIAELANFIYIRQKGPYGNGTPVLNARHVIGNEPFAVLWGDQFTWSSSIPRLKQCIDVFERYGDPVLSAVRLEKDEDAARYGIFDVEATEDKGIYHMKGFVEKPDPKEAPSNLLADGAYILTPDIFDELSGLKPGKSDEIWLADAIDQLSKKRQFYVREVDEGRYYDTGNKLEYIKANLDFAMLRPDLGPELRDYMQGLLNSDQK